MTATANELATATETGRVTALAMIEDDEIPEIEKHAFDALAHDLRSNGISVTPENVEALFSAFELGFFEAVAKHAIDACPIFADSTPADPDAKPWRVASLDNACHVARVVCDEAFDAYAEHLGKTKTGTARVWIGLRDNRDPERHSARIVKLVERIRLTGLRVSVVKSRGRPAALRVLDR